MSNKVFSAPCGCVVTVRNMDGRFSAETLPDETAIDFCRRHRGRRVTGAPSYGGGTSAAAGASLKGELAAMEELVFRFIRGRPCHGGIAPHLHLSCGATAHEVANGTGIALVTARARINQLMNRGRIVDGGRRRETPGGRMSIVWEAV